jgi:hypothetical protein
MTKTYGSSYLEESALPLLWTVTAIAAVVACFWFSLFYLSRPTSVPNPGLAAPVAPYCGMRQQLARSGEPLGSLSPEMTVGSLSPGARRITKLRAIVVQSPHCDSPPASTGQSRLWV